MLFRSGKARLVPQLGSIGTDSVVKEERVYPLEYPVGAETITNITIKLPSNLMVEYLPEDIKIDSQWIDFENKYVKNNSIIYFYERYRLKKKFISQDEYKDYKKLLEDIARKANQNITLEEK